MRTVGTVSLKVVHWNNMYVCIMKLGDVDEHSVMLYFKYVAVIMTDFVFIVVGIIMTLHDSFVSAHLYIICMIYFYIDELRCCKYRYNDVVQVFTVGFNKLLQY